MTGTTEEPTKCSTSYHHEVLQRGEDRLAHGTNREMKYERLGSSVTVSDLKCDASGAGSDVCSYRRFTFDATDRKKSAATCAGASP